MQRIDLETLIQFLQTSISPVVMISGVGLLVLSITNRFGRTIDRTRGLAEELRTKDHVSETARTQIHILYRRCKILLLAIVFSLTSIFLVSLLIILLFLNHLTDLSFIKVISGLFILSLVSLIISLSFFIKDMSLSLKALGLELKELNGN